MSLARTGLPVEYRIPSRSWNAYVRPPSVTVGSAFARSATTVPPSGPGTRFRLTRPSFVTASESHTTGNHAAKLSGSTDGRSRSPSSLAPAMVNVPPRCSVRDVVVVIAAPSPTVATSCGLAPTARLGLICPVLASRRTIFAERRAATQTASPTTATPCGSSPPVGNVATTSVPGSIRETDPSRLLVTQTASAPMAMPLGPWPTAIGVRRGIGGRIDRRHRPDRLVRDPHLAKPDRDSRGVGPDREACATSRPVSGSIFATAPSTLSATHTAPKPTAIPDGPLPT